MESGSEGIMESGTGGIRGWGPGEGQRRWPCRHPEEHVMTVGTSSQKCIFHIVSIRR